MVSIVVLDDLASCFYHLMQAKHDDGLDFEFVNAALSISLSVLNLAFVLNFA